MLSARDVLKHSSKISGANFVGAALSVPVGIVVARVLGPELLGTIGIVVLWFQYAGWARPGLMAAAYREMPHLLGQHREAEALRLQNVAMTYEGLLTLAPALLMATFAFIYRDPVLKFGLAVASVQFLLSTANYFRGSVQWTYQRFRIVARVTLGSRVAIPLLTLAGVLLAGAYGQLVAPVFLELGVVTYYVLRSPPLQFAPVWDGHEATRLLRIGLPLSLLGVLYWGFRTADRTMVALWLPVAQLGFFTFGLNFINLGIQFIADFTNVLQPGLYAELGRLGKVSPLSERIAGLGAVILLVTAVGANLAQAGFGAFVYAFVPKFGPSIPVFEILAFNLACGTAPILPSLLLYSTLLNRQNLMVGVQLAALGVNVALGITALKLGFGLVGIASSSVVSQLFLAIAYYGYTHRPLFERVAGARPLRVYGQLVGLLTVCAATYALMLVFGRYRAGEGSWHVMGVRLLCVAAVWLAVGGGYFAYRLLVPGARPSPVAGERGS